MSRFEMNIGMSASIGPVQVWGETTRLLLVAWLPVLLADRLNNVEIGRWFSESRQDSGARLCRNPVGCRYSWLAIIMTIII